MYTRVQESKKEGLDLVALPPDQLWGERDISGQRQVFWWLAFAKMHTDGSQQWHLCHNVDVD
jgi:hypothetical protein